ncbi:retrovirus-related pol polyprotein from transposon TNT 1-94, partial [Tanacetum coccineum]
EDNVGNQFRPNAMQNVGNQVVLNASQNPAPSAEGNSNEINGNQIRCYNYRGEGHYANNCTVKPRKRDAAYLQQQLANANCTLENNLQQTSTSCTQTDKAPVYDSHGSAEVHLLENCYDNDIFNMFTQEEQYTGLLEPFLEPHQVQQNDSNVTSVVSSVEQGGGTVEQHPANVEETRVLYDSLYNNLAIEVENVNSVNRKLRETNAELTTKLARYKNQESSGKQITALNEEISNLNKQLSKKKTIVSSLQEDKKRLKSGFKIREDEFLDK